MTSSGSLRRLAAATPPRKTARVIADVIIEHIISGGYLAGDFLPNVEALREHFSTSKPTLREALNLVEGAGFIRMRRGPGGGAEVIVPDSTELVRDLARAMRAEHASSEDAYVLLFALLPLCARYATTRATAPQIASLIETLTELRESDDEYVSAASAPVLAFHQVLADSCGSPPLRAFTSVLLNLVASGDPGWSPEPDEVARMTGEMGKIAEAVESGRVEEAATLTSRHLASTGLFNPSHDRGVVRSRGRTGADSMRPSASQGVLR